MSIITLGDLMKRVFIINPIAGKGKTLLIAETIKSICEQEHLDYIIHYTKNKQDATIIAKQYSNTLEQTIVYSVGGDGTLNEVVNGLALGTSMLGIIPAGTGNDFAKSLYDYKQPIITVDLGKVNNKYFLNIVSWGIDANIANNVDIMKEKNIPSNMVYYASILYTLFKYQGCDISINSEGWQNGITLLAVCNGKSYGGGISIAPNAKIDDGYLDIYLVDKLSKIKILFLLTELLKGNHEKYSCVHHLKARNIKISSNQPIICNIDGEMIKDNTFNVSIMENGINVVKEDHPKIMQLIGNMSKH